MRLNLLWGLFSTGSTANAMAGLTDFLLSKGTSTIVQLTSNHAAPTITKSSDKNCAILVTRFVELNKDTPDCQQWSFASSGHDVDLEFLALSNLYVESYDANHYFPDNLEDLTQLPANLPFPRPIYAQHKCRMLQDWKGCKKTFIQSGLDQYEYWYMKCKSADQYPDMYVHITDYLKDVIALCRRKEQGLSEWEWTKEYLENRFTGKKPSAAIDQGTVQDAEAKKQSRDVISCVDTAEASSSRPE